MYKRILALEYVVGPGGTVAPYNDVVLERDRETATVYLSHLSARLTRPVADVIIDHTRTQNIDNSVMSTHGRAGLSRWVYGSVADRVLRGAHCPTLIIRGTPVELPASAS